MLEYKKSIVKNRQAYFKYFIHETLEAGIVLTGSEVKVLREGKVSIEESHAEIVNNEVQLYNSYIAEYDKANRNNHNPRRTRKILLHSYEIKKLLGKIRIKGYTIIILSLFFNNKNIVKVELGIVKGKKLFDKRQSIKEKDWIRDQARLLKNHSK